MKLNINSLLPIDDKKNIPVLNMKQAVYYGLFILMIFIFKINSHLTFAEPVNNIKKQNIVSSTSQIKEFSIQKMSANLTLSVISFVSVNSSNRDIVVTLPLPKTMPGKKYFIKKTSILNTVIVNANDKKIDKCSTYNLTSGNLSCVELYCDGVQWHVMSRFD